MNRSFFVAIFLLLIVIACSKKDKPQDPPPGNTTYSIDSTNVLPTQLVIMKSSKPVTADSVTVMLGNQPLLLTKVDTFQYVFSVPILAAGDYTFDLKSIDAENQPAITIGNYNSISDPQAVIDEYVNSSDDLIDSPQSNNANNTFTEEDAAFLTAINNQIRENMQNATADQRLHFAYQLQLQSAKRQLPQLIPSDTAFAPYDASQSVLAIDYLAEYIQSLARNASIETEYLTGYEYFFRFSAKIVLKNPTIEFWSGFLRTMMDYQVRKETAAKFTARAASITGVLVDGMSTADNSGTESKPLVLAPNDTMEKRMVATFRTIRLTDEDKLTPEITELIKINRQVETEDEKIKSIFDEVRDFIGAGHYIEPVKYQSFRSPILETPIIKTAPIRSDRINIASVSNPQINVTTQAVNGYNLIFAFERINPSQVNYDFTFQLTYAQEIFNTSAMLTMHGRWTTKIKVGETFAGGLIFYIDGTGKHGPVCTAQDVGEFPWDMTIFNTSDPYNYYPPLIESNLAGIMMGDDNTKKIVNKLGDGIYAAWTCDLWDIDGYNDWWLPSKDELWLMYNNLHLAGLGNFSITNSAGCTTCPGGAYWTSTEIDFRAVWYQRFDNGQQVDNAWKNNKMYVRAVRAF